MAKKPSTLKNMLIALFVITAVSGGLLGLVYGLTKDTIKEVEKEKTKKAIKEVLPLEEEFDTKDTTITFDDNGVSTSLPCYIAYNANKDPIGIAIKTTEGGFGGNIELMVGIIPPGIIKGVSVLSHSETPGLGANMTGPFKDQFTDKNPSEFKLAVKKDGGDVDAITAATITSRAFSKAIDKAYRAYEANKTNLKGGQQ